MASKAEYILALFLSLTAIAVTASAAGIIGVTYGRMADDLPCPSDVVKLLMNNKVNHVRIYDTDHDVLTAFSGTGISLIVGLLNDQICQAANDQSFTDDWVNTNIRSFYPATNITAIAVGNDVIKENPELNDKIVPAMRNLHNSLKKFKIDCSIKVSSPFPFYEVLAVTFPPSSGAFRSDLIEPVIKPLLNFLDETSSYFMLNLFPYYAYSRNHAEISHEPEDAILRPSANAVLNNQQNPPYTIGYATGSGGKTIYDPKTKTIYRSLPVQQLDTVKTATFMRDNHNRRLDSTHRGLVGRDNVGRNKIVVTETGWPSLGIVSQQAVETTPPVVEVGLLNTPAPTPSCSVSREVEFGANKKNAAAYNGNLVKRVLSGRGTPVAPHQPLEVYIYSLFNENLKKGNVSERNYGLFYPNEEKVYNISLTGC